MKRGFKHDFTLLAISLIPIGVAINVITGELVNLLKIPLFLNAIGTIIIAMVAGPWVGMVTGGVTNLIMGMFNPVSFAFGLVSMAIGLTVGFLSTKGMMTNIWKVIISGFIVTLVTLVVSSPITILVFGGVTGTGSDAFTGVLLASGQEIWSAVITQKIFVESADKIFSTLVAFWVIKKMSTRYLSKHNYGSMYIKN